MEEVAKRIQDLPVSLRQLDLLHHLKVEHGLISPHMVKSPPYYYDLPLEGRRDILQAPSIHHLCKTIVMRNTAFKTKTVDGKEMPDMDYCHPLYYPLYICVVTQYTAKYVGEKVGKVVKKEYDTHIKEPKIGKQFFHFRQADEEESKELTGYEKGGVVPVNLKTKLPVLLSKSVALIEPNYFWMGGGEICLKLGMTVADFKRYHKDNLLIGNISD